jgi:hypothetical protein
MRSINNCYFNHTVCLSFFSSQIPYCPLPKVKCNQQTRKQERSTTTIVLPDSVFLLRYFQNHFFKQSWKVSVNNLEILFKSAHGYWEYMIVSFTSCAFSKKELALTSAASLKSQDQVLYFPRKT